MSALISMYNAFFRSLDRLFSPWLLPSLARFTFAALLLVYFWKSAWLKLGDGLIGIFVPGSGAYFQIFPRAIEAAGYDPAMLPIWDHVIALAGTWAELALPAMIVVGLFTRLSALGMIGFILVQTLTDLYGHGLINDPKTLGAWFDGDPTGAIMDQRLLWIALLAIPLMRGAGPVSLDRLLMGVGLDRGQREHPA